MYPNSQPFELCGSCEYGYAESTPFQSSAESSIGPETGRCVPNFVSLQHRAGNSETDGQTWFQCHGLRIRIRAELFGVFATGVLGWGCASEVGAIFYATCDFRVWAFALNSRWKRRGRSQCLSAVGGTTGVSPTIKPDCARLPTSMVNSVLDSEGVTNRRRSALGILTSSAVATFIVSIQALILMPLYLRFVGPKMFGAWLASGDLFFYLNALEFGIPNLMIQRIGASLARHDLPAVGRWTASGLAILGGGATILFVLCFALAHRLPGWFNVVGDDAVILTRCFLLGGAAAALTLLNQAFVALARGLQDTQYQNASAVVSSLFGFGAALGSVLHGAGLYSIPVSLGVRALCSAAFSVAFWFRKVPAAVRTNFVPDRTTLKTLLQLSPLTALGSLCYTASTQSENLLVGLIAGTDAAIVLSLTRRGAEVLKNLIDMIAHASFGAFSHLVVSPQRQKSAAVFDELIGLRLGVAVMGAAGYMALNETFVRIWVGSSYYGGWTVTALIALNLIFSGQSYLVNTLYRATGHITSGSLLLVAEALFRLPLAAAGTSLFGLVGLQAAAVVTALGSLTAGSLLCRRVWRKMTAETPKKGGYPYASHSAVFALGFICCLAAWQAGGGLGLLLPAWGLLGMACIYLVRTNPFLRDMLSSLSPWVLRRLRFP